MKCEIYETTPPNPVKGWKANMGVFGWAGDKLMVPITGFAMSEGEAFLGCSDDGVPIVQTHGTFLVPEEWVRNEKRHHPEVLKILDKMREIATGARNDCMS
jgi:hypothetical protein